jgi:hypothetical protein
MANLIRMAFRDMLTTLWGAVTPQESAAFRKSSAASCATVPEKMPVNLL